MEDFKSRRRDANAKVGFVNFPTNSIPNSGEGGIFVRLVVIDNKPYENKFVPCCGGYQEFFMDETFLGDDLLDSELSNASDMFDEEFIKKENDKKYFPNLYSQEEEQEHYRYLSRSFLTVMTIGATGWSSEWRCRFSDLAEEGKQLVANLEKLYPECEIRLLTFLDT